MKRRRIRDYFARYRGAFVFGMLALVGTQAFALTIPQLLRIGTDALVDGDGDEVTRAAYLLLGVAVLGAIVRITSRILIFNSGRNVEFDIRNDAFEHLMKLGRGFYQKMPLGQVMSRMVNDLTQVRLILGPGILNLTNTALVYIVVLPILFYSDWELTLYSLSALPLLIMLGRVFAKRIYTLSRTQQQRLGTLSEKVQENLSGIMTVRAYGREEAESGTFRRLNDDYFDVNIKLARLRGTMFPLMGMAGAVASVVVLWIGGHRIADGRMTIGEFVQFNAYLAALTWPTIALGWMISLWQRGMAAMDRLNDIFEAEPELRDGGLEPPPFSGKIALTNLTYRYEEGAEPALSGVSTEINGGETIVVVGRTGSGKSTLLRALARLLVLDRGQMSIDGIDVNDLPLSFVRSLVGFAPQDAFLFSRTLFENVAFGVPDALESEVEGAVQAASLDTDVAGFTNGLDTVVGERGITLSGGQRQRTTLARALLVDSPILLLDDTLSAVDTETESRIVLELLAQKKTTVVATHRLAFAAHADRILVLENGRVVEQGTEVELLELDGIYAQMHRRQRLKEALEGAAA